VALVPPDLLFFKIRETERGVQNKPEEIFNDPHIKNEGKKLQFHLRTNRFEQIDQMKHGKNEELHPEMVSGEFPAPRQKPGKNVIPRNAPRRKVVRPPPLSLDLDLRFRKTKTHPQH